MKVGARFYDPTIGRWIQKDPILSGVNWWVYCENEPVNYVDPKGLAYTYCPKCGTWYDASYPSCPTPGCGAPNYNLQPESSPFAGWQYQIGGNPWQPYPGGKPSAPPPMFPPFWESFKQFIGEIWEAYTRFVKIVWEVQVLIMKALWEFIKHRII